MDDKWNDVLSSLPPKRPRSRLEPYWELIEEMRRRGWTYREITRVLAEKCQVRVSASNLHHFVRRRPETVKVGAPFPAADDSSSKQSEPQSRSDVSRRIAEVKQQRAVESPRHEAFDFDPREPLRLQRPDRKNSSH
jgi:hypothetical protein